MAVNEDRHALNPLPNWLRASWDSVRTSLWFVPGLGFAAGAVLAPLMLGVDREGAVDHGRRWWLTSGSGEDAANLLSTLVTSIIAMASIVFSLTVVAISLAANTYGPRLIRVFRGDRRTQGVLALLVLTIVYLLIILRAIRGEMDFPEVPHLSVTLGVVLSLSCIMALLVFLQGVARSMGADEVVHKVRREFDATVEELPDLTAGTPARASLPGDFDETASRIRLPREGYVQAVDYEALVEWAVRNDCSLRLDFKPGDFVVDGDRKVLVHPAPADDEAVRSEIGGFIVSGDERTPTQDLEFAIRHLVEVAVRALSPGINDPFTAMAVIDRLRGGLARLARKQLPPDRLLDRHGQLRIVRHVPDFPEAVDAALNQIRQAGSSKPSVLIHMAEAIRKLAEHLRTAEQREALGKHLRLIRRAGRRDVADEEDLQSVEDAVAAAERALAELEFRSSAGRRR